MPTRKIYRKLLKKIEAVGPGSLHEFLRRRAFRGRGRDLPPVIVMSLPKSGSIFLTQSLCKALQLRRGRLGSYGFTEPTVQPNAIKRIRGGNMVIQEHLPASDHVLASLAVLVPGIIVHIRDPRRALISWIGHLNDLLGAQRMIDAYGFAEHVMPDDYLQWDAEQQLDWHITHVLPRLVTWVEGWVRAKDDPSTRLKIALSTLEELQSDQEKTLRRLLDEIGVSYQDDWLKLPGPKVGAMNVRRDPSVDRKSKYTPAQWERASAMVPAALRQRFNWA
jgi:hypothetical protein